MPCQVGLGASRSRRGVDDMETWNGVLSSVAHKRVLRKWESGIRIPRIFITVQSIVSTVRLRLACSSLCSLCSFFAIILTTSPSLPYSLPPFPFEFRTPCPILSTSLFFFGCRMRASPHHQRSWVSTSAPFVRAPAPANPATTISAPAFCLVLSFTLRM